MEGLRFRALILFCAFFICVPVSGVGNAAPFKVEVFYHGESNNSLPPPLPSEFPGEIIYYQMDKASGLLQEVNSNIPNNLEQASAHMSRFMNSANGRQIFKEIADSYQSVGRAVALQLPEIPAVVINERYVVYGTTDVAAAIQSYKKWKEVNE
ncbi:TPA: TIGR03757 family integrating conjugative element protein [Shewanella algae]|uniref:TIGR03757 family integrating conjugative element protein n=1 Tax=Shewanella algae TaxID=38313 RepID=UPI001C55EA4D|nr:TIGR03757 family integrating conjugative element protein [Shewanella algae]HDS1208438.1 TIGR03757 family integrating conjugative element protein [Shewanella algae]